MTKTSIYWIAGGRVEGKAVEGPPSKVVAEVIASSLLSWKPESSDLIVTKHVDGEERIYVVSIKGFWKGKKYVESEFIIVSPSQLKDEKLKKVLREVGAELTSNES